ncbi:uncharacterized protein LOC130969058 isoform X2 [Arachis stenosperma]|uniref:uncharacterized protein LOC130969058 isoform X2 n=1 Tax=Arachis stenosperma TaxID=217475 RepID=UPI0025ACA523|nr:uncharacterized protein LOC130969058 isoform X2 [Arachis stenosperma]XP_057750611.1 uncharacterized protein LOC130969058 isoform X2 [Arachis stenosperma]XP_057750612.1 uncharacterized protein LOC130969058 isoform X2 [Arachis stenosperma]XP_057750614.1 uncharacterized protein LOC130969058 isoform X2 [Arachis stenosperma]
MHDALWVYTARSGPKTRPGPEGFWMAKGLTRSDPGRTRGKTMKPRKDMKPGPGHGSGHPDPARWPGHIYNNTKHTHYRFEIRERGLGHIQISVTPFYFPFTASLRAQRLRLTPTPPVPSPHSPLRHRQSPLPTAQADLVTPDLIFSPHGPFLVSQHAATHQAVAHSSRSRLFSTFLVPPQLPAKVFVRLTTVTTYGAALLLGDVKFFSNTAPPLLCSASPAPSAPLSSPVFFSGLLLSTGGRVLDVFRSSLSPLMAEALICTQSWLCPSKQQVGDQEFDQFDSSQKIVEGFTNASTSQGTS